MACCHRLVDLIRLLVCWEVFLVLVCLIQCVLPISPSFDFVRGFPFLSFIGFSVCCNLLESFSVIIYSSHQIPCPAASSAVQPVCQCDPVYLSWCFLNIFICCCVVSFCFHCSCPAYVQCHFLFLLHIQFPHGINRNPLFVLSLSSSNNFFTCFLPHFLHVLSLCLDVCIIIL